MGPKGYTTPQSRVCKHKETKYEGWLRGGCRNSHSVKRREEGRLPPVCQMA